MFWRGAGFLVAILKEVGFGWEERVASVVVEQVVVVAGIKWRLKRVGTLFLGHLWRESKC